MGVTAKSSHLFIGFSIILTIHFGFFPPIFGNSQIATSLANIFLKMNG